MKQKLTELKKEIDNSTIIVGDFNISLSVIDRTRHKWVRAEKQAQSPLYNWQLYNATSNKNRIGILFKCT